MVKPTTCICQCCACRSTCEYFEETVKPVINVVAVNLYEMSDPFVCKLDEALESFTCEYFEEERK